MSVRRGTLVYWCLRLWFTLTIVIHIFLSLAGLAQTPFLFAMYQKSSTLGKYSEGQRENRFSLKSSAEWTRVRSQRTGHHRCWLTRRGHREKERVASFFFPVSLVSISNWHSDLSDSWNKWTHITYIYIVLRMCVMYFKWPFHPTGGGVTLLHIV